MVTQTPRFDLDKYSQGEDNWSHSDTVDFVDEFSIERGQSADRPDSGEYDNEFYYSVDINTLWCWDESSGEWEAIGGAGTDSDPLPDTLYRSGMDVQALLAIPVFMGDQFAPDSSIFFHSDEEQIKYKDDSGDVYAAATPGTPVSYEPGHTEWSTATDEEIYRFNVPSGSVFELQMMEFASKGGGSADTNKSIDVYDDSNGTEMASVDLDDGVSEPGAISSDGATILVRITTDADITDGESITGASPVVRGVIE